MKNLIRLLALALALSPTALLAGDGPLMVRLRGVYIGPADTSDAIPSLGVPADAITVSTKTIPEVDLSYFFSKSIAAELVLTYPQEHDVELGGTKIGTFKHLPPTLTLQYHFLPDSVFNPYVGVGVNLTLISDVNLAVPGVGALDLESSSIGFAAGAGFDVKVGEKLYLNADAKWVQIGSDVVLKASGAKVSAVKVDPWLIGAGIGYRF
ncbi:MAG: OmpW family protein [Holophagales bacterium]|jgi:outer membrane protein|nr:OmpW family protein [Holophagales bacterium]